MTEPETPAPSPADPTPDPAPAPAADGSGAAPGGSKKVWIIVAVVVVVVVAAGAAIYLATRSSSSSSGTYPAKSAKAFYAAWNTGDRSAAAGVATPAAVAQLFAVSKADASGLAFGGCQQVGAALLPKVCVFSRPGGGLSMTVMNIDGVRKVTAVKVGPVAVAPSTTPSTTPATTG